MFLKSLVVRGFKSFADKTNLLFEPGVTIVVGPNGSGKSNIVDAISWVLGEQGPSSLRGGKMQDVIYAGTPGRPALGMAEVTLTIDNSAGLLPIEFAEVTISRTLFRSGDSEYRLNGSSCRLLDIQEVLSDTGVGREQHTIVGQGQLDQVLNAGPEQMRGFIEEAAGVGKHRRRKERAVRKITSTEHNLERLSDLLAEIRRQLRPLREQAEVAKRYDKVAEEARRVRAIVASRELAKALDSLGPGGSEGHEHKLEQAQAEFVELESRLQLAENERSSASALTESSRETAWEFSRSIERLEALCLLAATRSRALEAELAATTEVAAQAQVYELERQERETQDILLEAGQAVEAAERSAEEAKSTFELTADQLRLSEEALAARALQNEKIFVVLVSEVTQLAEQVGDLRRELDRSLAALEQFGGKDQARNTIGILAESLAAFETKLGSIRPALEGGRDEVEQLRQSNPRAADSHKAATARHDEARMNAGLAGERQRLLAERITGIKAALQEAVDSVSGVASRRQKLSAAVATSSSIADAAEVLSSQVAEWAEIAGEKARESKALLEKLDEQIVQMRLKRTELGEGLDALRARARQEDLSRGEARLKVRLLEEKLRRELDMDPAQMVKKFGQRWEVEDPSRLADPLEILALSDDEHLRRRDFRLTAQLQQMGKVNPLAAGEFEALTEREQFLAGQMSDLRSSRRDLARVVSSVDEKVEELFSSAFGDVAREYERLFSLLFPGGKGKLKLTDPTDLLSAGVEIEARPGGKNLKRLSLLSGGERALSALAVLFAIFRARPSPFYILDEVEAALDDVNLHRFLNLLSDFRNSSQLLVVTHQKRTMEIADVLYGVSVGPDGTSKVISQRLSNAASMEKASDYSS